MCKISSIHHDCIVDGHFEPHGDIMKIRLLIFDEDAKFVAYGSASIYSSKHNNRTYGCDFSQNKHRAFWIDSVRSFNRRKGYGTLVLKLLQELLENNRHLAEPESLNNIYLLTKYKNHAFYFRNGYDEVDFVKGSERDCENYMDLSYGVACLHVYGKPMEKKLHSERYMFDMSALDGSGFDQAIATGRKELNDIPIDQLCKLFIEYNENRGEDFDDYEIFLDGYLPIDKDKCEIVRSHIINYLKENNIVLNKDDD
jgi:hypothetical protein